MRFPCRDISEAVHIWRQESPTKIKRMRARALKKIQARVSIKKKRRHQKYGERRFFCQK